MGDRFSSPRVFADPAADIADLYAFPSPARSCRARPHRVSRATVAALFSDAITYRSRIRPVTIAGAARAYTVGQDEHTFDFTFTGDGAGAPAQAGTCTTAGGEQVSFRAEAQLRREKLAEATFA